MRGLERDLIEHDAPARRMIERALAAFALEHVLRRPVAREGIARGGEIVDERARRRIVQMADRIGAEFGRQTPRARFPVDDQRARRRRRERVREQIAVVLAVEPADEQRRRMLVPAQRVPLTIEHVGGRADQPDGLEQRGGRVLRSRIGLGGIALGGELEKIRTFGARQLQRDGDAREGIGGSGHGPALLDPGVPGRAHAAQLRDFFAAQAGRAAARAGRESDRLRRQPFAMRADELAKRVRGRFGEGFVLVDVIHAWQVVYIPE
ncbi:hypothetical protein BG60_30290 [Caballeronia zhejiangensis]|uniref:Uncharacterized protein n=1 Tax=Caballeronia zhejiangensis TaxID=871203 RepID=A0A656QNK3_9BURK|nr:hypothetical protein BG60_30290 [Caballeronia zhejiangensis]